ncbi:hypothetical protein [Treponema ruminis]|uniref:Uncharacterized protein n=1 Tax=Treponema ruminis TaxID=744515 RepID=A0A7W8G849_9SPIR|nr:hypothetical protein [Treponema ruminis]MBB5225637.1 hypothetical protein [Treponema ruminis]
MKNLFRAKSARFIVTVCASAFIALAAGISFSCSFLEDDGFFDKIEGEVSVANADKMNVYLRYASIKFGKTTPVDAASYQVKNNVAFSVTAVTNSDYAFYRWAAFSTKDFDVAKQHMSMVYANDDDYYANFGSLELDASVVKFENPRAETTNVTVLQTRDDIWIMPVIAVRPTIAGTFPGTSQIPVRNTKLRVQFSKPMDIESFEGNFIISQATRAADFSLNETDISEKFKMEINEKGNLVTFSFRDTAEMFNPAVVVRLYFTDDVADSTGYTMADSKTLEWNIGTYVDTLPPLITEMTAGIGSDCSKFASTPTRLADTATADLSNSLYTGELLTHRVKNKVNLYVYAQDIAQANGERMESDVLMLGFRAKSITDLEGNAIDGNAEGNFIPNVIDTYAAGQNLSEINGAFRTITGGKSAGCLYTYDLSSLPDGLIQIEVYAVDSTGNDGLTGYDPSIDDADGMGNGPRSVFVIKDNRAPAIENELEKIKSSSIVAPFGWYNKQTIDSVEIYDETSDPIRDFGHQKLAAAHENLKWVCHLGTSTDWQVAADDKAWVPVSERYKIGAAAVDSDGPVSVTIRLMDDLGNISKAMQISSVLCDNSAPETGKVYCVDASGAQGLNSTKDVVVPESMLIKVPFTEELCGVKVFGLTIKASDGKQVENAFEHASILYSVEESPEKAAAVAIEADTSSLQDVLNSKGNVGASIFPNGIESLHVLQSSYNTGIFYIKNLTLGEADGMYTVTITLYDSALNKAGEKTVMLAHDTMPPVVDRVVIKNVVPRLVYDENETTYWLPGSAYDENKDAKYVTVAVTATENGSGVKVITLGENAHITEDTSFIIEGRAVSSDRCTIDAKTNTVTLFDYEQPDLYKQTGSIGFELTNIRLDKPNSEEGNKVSVSLQDFVDNTGSNENAGNFDLYIDDTSTSPIYQVFSDSQIPAIAEKSPALADGKADSATDEKTFAEARLVSVYTDTKNVDLSLKLSPETNGSGVRSLSLSNGLFTGETAVYVDGKLLAQTEYTLDGSIVTFVNYVFTAANTFKFTNVELQGSDDGLQLISITATDFTGWVSKEVSTPMITLDRAAPVVGEVTWHLKEGVYGVSKAAVVSNMDLCLPFTEVMTGVKVLRIDPKLNDSSSSATPFDSADFAIKYISNADIDALAESAGEGGETKPADTATLIENAKLLKAEADYTVKDNYITFTEPQKYTSGLFVLQNIKVADTFEDNKSYKINLHLADAALNGCAADGTIDLESDSTSPKIQRIFINRLIARTQPGETVDSYWISKEDFEEAGKVPAKLELELTIAESGSGVKTVELGENLRLTAASEITCGTTKLVKGSDYKVSSDFATITLITNSKPTFRSENGDFTVTITNATLTAEGENKISVKLTDFALNTDDDSKSSDIAYKADSTETVPSVFVDFTAPLLLEGGVKIVDRGGSEAINGTADADANTVALEGFTNEKLVNVAVKTAAPAGGKAKRSGVKHLVISGGARFTSSSKFYYKDLDAADTAALTHADAATNGDGYEEITGVERSSDNLTATLPYSYACEKVCEFIVTNVELTGEEGENQVSIYPVDLTGWSDSEKAVNDKITLDTTAPAWGNNANAAVVMGTIGENGNDADYVWPKTSGARILASDGEVYFYKRPQGTESEPIYLTVNASDTNFYGLYFVSDASDKTSGAVAIAAKESNKAILTKITDVKFDASSNHEYTIVLKDRAGNISTETKSVHVVKDGEAEIVNDDDESSSLQNNMEYKESRENYHIFKTSVPKTLTREESEGVDGVSGVSGYAVYYNDGNGGKDGVNPVTIEVNLANHKEKNFTINSGVAYYAINGSAQAPAAVLEGEYAAPTTALQNWNKWIPFTSGTTKLTLYPKNDGKNPLNMRLWFKDNVGNVKSVEIKQKTEAGLQAEPDIWICDNTIPQNANGTDDGFVPENNQLSANGLDFDYMMPDHMWKVGSSASSAVLKVMYAAGLESEKEKGKTDNRIFFSDNAKASFVINNEPSETVAIESGNADSDNWAVRLFLYPSNSATTPSREVVMSWIKEDANKNKYFYGIPSGSTITLSNIEYPKECSETTPYIYVVAEDRVGNINISKLNVKVNAAEYGSTAAAKDYWYGKFVYSADEEAPQIWLGGTGVHGDGTKVDVNADSYSSAEEIAKLVPYNDGRRSSVDSTTGITWVSSNKYKNSAKTDTGINTKHDYPNYSSDTYNKYRMFFYIDVDSFAPYAYYYSHLPEIEETSSISGIISNIYSPNDKWTIIDGNSVEHEGKVPVSIGNLDAMAKENSAKEIYLHVADKLGRVKTVRLGNTKYQVDNTAPTVNFGSETTGLHINDNQNLYRIDAKSTNSLAITFSQDASDKIRNGETVYVYIPHSYITESGSGLYGYSWDEYLAEDSLASCEDGNGYYLEFTNNDSNAKKSISITSNKFYVFDKVGNKTPITITSSVDDNPPELTMKFGAQYIEALTEKYPALATALEGKDFTDGKIYDASAKKLLECNVEPDSENAAIATDSFSGTFKTSGNSEKIGYTKENPYTIYSNAKNSGTAYGYIQGTFVVRDKNGTDTTGYSGLLTEISVNRYVITSNGTEKIIGTEAQKYPFAVPAKASDSTYTVKMPIYLDGDGDSPYQTASTGYKGKLYEITVKDSGGNATTIYLAVMRDRTGPKFKCGDGYVGQDSYHRAVVQGGVGYYGGKVFYQSSGTNQAYVKLPKTAAYSDGSDSQGAAYDEDCGVLEKNSSGKYKDILKGVNSSSSYETLPGSPDEDGYVNYKLGGNGSSGYSFCLYAIDILGNKATYNLSVENNEIPVSDKVYCIDNTKPTVSAFEMTTSSYGKFSSDTIHFNYNANYDKYNGYKKDGGFQGFTIKVTTSDANKTSVTSVAKYCFISTDSGITSVPTDWTEYTKKETNSSTPNTFTFTIVPKDYFNLAVPDSDPRYIYFYTVDYAGNLSSAKKLTIKINDERPSISKDDTSVSNYVPSEDGSVYYFNKNTTVSTKLTAIGTSDPIRWYGVYDNWDNARFGYSIAATEVDRGDSSTYTGGTITFSFAAYGKTSDGKLHAENSGAKSQFTGSGSLFIETWSVGNVPAKEYYLPSGTEATWTYDGTAAAPSTVSIPNTESLAYTSTKASDANKVWYSKAVDDREDKTFYVNVNFPEDVAGIKGYKIKIGTDSWSTTKTFSETPASSYSATARKIPINVTSITTASDITTNGKKVYIKAVDGLGNESEPYEFTVIKITNAPKVTGIKIGTGEVTADGTIKVESAQRIYVNGETTAITIIPELEYDDITDIVGFALSATGGYSPKGTGGTYTIELSDLPSDKDGCKPYTIYAKNGIGLYSASAYTLKIFRDVTGPEVKSLTLSIDSSKSANLLAESGSNNLYYNDKNAIINSVGENDVLIEEYENTKTMGSGLPDNKVFAITTSNTEVPTTWFAAGSLLLGKHDALSSAIYIAAKDYLGNISRTPLSSVKITVGENSEVTINKFICDETRPEPPTSVAISPNDSFKDGWYSVGSTSTEKNIDLYYNNKVSNTNITVTPSLAAADSSLLGYRVGTDGTVNEELTIQLSPGDAKIYAVDKAGNVSESAYVIQMIQDNTVAAPTLPDNAAENPVINDASKDVAFWDSTNSIVYFKNDTSLTEIKLNVNFTAEDATASGLRGYQINSSTITTTSIQPISATNPTLVTIPIPSSLTDGSFSATIHTVDYVGNINSDSEALTVKFKKLTNAKDVTGIGETIETTGEGGSFKRGTDVDGAAVIYVNGSVESVTVTPTFTTTDVTGIKGFAPASNGTVSTSNETFTLDVDKTKESKTYEIYAVNKVGLYSAAAYKVTIIRDTTGPVVSEITLVKASNGTANLVTETESEVSVNNLYFNKAGLKIKAVTAEDSKISGDTELPGAGLGPDPEVKYSLVANGVLTDENRTFINTYQYVPDHVSLTFELPLGQDPSSVTKNASEIYIAAIDKVGNIKLTPLSDVDITVGDATEAKKISKFVFDKDAPAVPSSIVLNDTTKEGNGVHLGAATADAQGKYSSTIYYNTDLLGVNTVSLTPSQTTADDDLDGFCIEYNQNKQYSAIDSTVELDFTKSTENPKAARIYAVDKAGNVSSRYKVWLTEDKVAAKTVKQVTGDQSYEGSVISVSTVGGNLVYYKSGLKLKVTLEANRSPITAYTTFVRGSDTDLGDPSIWKEISVDTSEGQKDVFVSLPDIKSLKSECSLCVKDAVGNKTEYINTDVNANPKPNALGDPANLTGRGLRDTWWHVYEKPTALSIKSKAETKKLTLTDFISSFPIKSLEITEFRPSSSGIKVDGELICPNLADPDKPLKITPASSSILDNSCKVVFTKGYIMEKLEINFDKDGLYFLDGSKVKITSVFDDDVVECDLTPSPKPEYVLDGTKLTISGLWSAYMIDYFSFLNNGISFNEGESKEMSSVKAYLGDKESAIISSSTGAIENDNKYIINFGDKKTCADKLVIEFESVPNLASDVKIELAHSKTDGMDFSLKMGTPADPATSIFTRFIDNVSSGITSIFSGRSMTHEELEALKEAKAEKAAARAAEKAAKKAAKKAARDAKKNAEIASASPKQGESWTGLSGEFESASSELDSALAKMKDSSGPEAKASDEVSSKNGIIKVKSGKKNAVSNSKELITDSTVRKTENHGNRMIYVFGFLAVLGVISGIFAKKVRKNSKKS